MKIFQFYGPIAIVSLLGFRSHDYIVLKKAMKKNLTELLRGDYQISSLSKTLEKPYYGVRFIPMLRDLWQLKDIFVANDIASIFFCEIVKFNILNEKITR